MKTRLVLAAALALAAITYAERPRASPHAEVSAIVGGKKLTIVYGRPFKKTAI